MNSTYLFLIIFIVTIAIIITIIYVFNLLVCVWVAATCCAPTENCAWNFFRLQEQFPFPHGSDDLQLHAIVCRTSFGATFVKGGSIVGINDLLDGSLSHPNIQGSMSGGWHSGLVSIGYTDNVILKGASQKPQK